MTREQKILIDGLRAFFGDPELTADRSVRHAVDAFVRRPVRPSYHGAPVISVGSMSDVAYMEGLSEGEED